MYHIGVIYIIYLRRVHIYTLINIIILPLCIFTTLIKAINDYTFSIGPRTVKCPLTSFGCLPPQKPQYTPVVMYVVFSEGP